jgi:hypothetical protein
MEGREIILLQIGRAPASDVYSERVELRPSIERRVTYTEAVE